MFMRTGCMKHLEKYSQLPPRATAPLPPAADELSATAAAIKQLPPVSCYKVIALAYRSYPMPEALRQQQRQQVAAAAAADAAVANGVDGVDAGAVSGGGSLAGAASGGTAAAAAHAANEPGMMYGFSANSCTTAAEALPRPLACKQVACSDWWSFVRRVCCLLVVVCSWGQSPGIRLAQPPGLL